MALDHPTDYLPARLLQTVGLIMLIASAVFWAVTGRQSTLFLSASMSLILLGAYRHTITTLKHGPGGSQEGNGSG